MMEQITTVDQNFIENRPLSYSSLKAFAKSPKHYIEYLNKPYEPTEALILGQLIDCLVLTPKLYENKFMVYQKPNLRTNAGKAEMESITEQARKEKLTLITQDQYTKAEICKQSLMDLDESRELIEKKTKVQTKLEWRDKTNNLPIVGYADMESKAWEGDWIVDLKSTKSADPDDFVRDAVKFGYQIQCGGYLDGFYKKFFRFPGFIFLAVETSEPYNVSVNICDNKYVEKAKEEWYGLLKAFRFCLDNDYFDKGYEFRLFGTKDYFNMTIPGYYKPSYPGGFDE